jgi:hypothetical protein
MKMILIARTYTKDLILSFKCEKCVFIASDTSILNDHISRVHGRKNTRTEDKPRERENKKQGKVLYIFKSKQQI